VAVQKLALPVLISSKQAEFQTEREDIYKIMKSMPLLAVDVAENWPPQSVPILEQSVQQARACAIYVGLYGCIYSQPTIEEYRAASENRYREILIYVKQCPSNRDPQLTDFLGQVMAPTTGYIVLTYSDWPKIRKQFTEHLWAAIGRMAMHALRLGEPPKALGDDAAVLEQQWEAEKSALLNLGLPADPKQALELADLLKSQQPKEPTGIWSKIAHRL
jgi:hypothetical protein